MDREKFEKWENENQIPKQVKQIVNAVLKELGYGEVFCDYEGESDEETIGLRNRGNWAYAYGKGFSMSYCTSSYSDGPDVDCKYIIKFIEGLGFYIANSFGDNGMDSTTNWHDTYWTYEFMYKPSQVYAEEFYDDEERECEPEEEPWYDEY